MLFYNEVLSHLTMGANKGGENIAQDMLQTGDKENGRLD